MLDTYILDYLGNTWSNSIMIPSSSHPFYCIAAVSQVDQVDASGSTALFHAAEAQQLEMLQYLLSQAVDGHLSRENTLFVFSLVEMGWLNGGGFTSKIGNIEDIWIMMG